MKRTQHFAGSASLSRPTRLALPRWRSSGEVQNECSLTSVLTQSFMWFCNAVVRWQHPSPELNEMFAHVSFHSHHKAWLYTSLNAPPDLASVQRDGGTAMGESTLDLRAIHRRTPPSSVPLMRSSLRYSSLRYTLSRRVLPVLACFLPAAIPMTSPI
jgi:hypothetical protein